MENSLSDVDRISAGVVVAIAQKDSEGSFAWRLLGMLRSFNECRFDVCCWLVEFQRIKCRRACCFNSMASEDYRYDVEMRAISL